MDKLSSVYQTQGIRSTFTVIIIQSNKPLRYLTAHEEEAAHQPLVVKYAKRDPVREFVHADKSEQRSLAQTYKETPTLDKLGRGLDKERRRRLLVLITSFYLTCNHSGMHYPAWLAIITRVLKWRIVPESPLHKYPRTSVAWSK
ncbi:hypothetical protein ACJJTC_002207 [Scirpophaga incertulas]